MWCEPLVNLCKGDRPVASRYKLLKNIPLLLEVLLKGLVDGGVQLVLRDDVHLATVVVHYLLDWGYEGAGGEGGWGVGHRCCCAC